MTKQDYIIRYNKVYSQVSNSFKKGYNIDDDYIYSNFLGDMLRYKIDDVLDLLNFYDRFKVYIYNLKKNDKILVNTYGNDEYVIISKINYKRKNKYNLPYKDKISSITVKTDYNEYKIKISDIVYNGVKFYDLKDVCIHFYIYMFFNEYTIKNADKILSKIRG